jgi:hypothetical protein
LREVCANPRELGLAKHLKVRVALGTLPSVAIGQGVLRRQDFVHHADVWLSAVYLFSWNA